MKFNSREEIIALTPLGKGERFPDGRPRVPDRYLEAMKKMTLEEFGFEKVAITLRTSISANDNDWAGMLYDGENYCFSKSYHLRIVDHVGGGDSFGGGLIYALLSGKTTQQAIEFAVAASALKHTVEGDYNRVMWRIIRLMKMGH